MEGIELQNALTQIKKQNKRLRKNNKELGDTNASLRDSNLRLSKENSQLRKKLFEQSIPRKKDNPIIEELFNYFERERTDHE